jgi:protein-tyrosine-phosphatase
MEPKALFFCTGNPARESIAEGYPRHVADEH